MGNSFSILRLRSANSILFLAGASLASLVTGCAGFVSGKPSTGQNPPSLTLSNVSPGFPTATSVSISWQTSVPANSQVNYGPSASYGSSTALDPSMVTTHRQTLSNLKPAT